MVNQNGGWTGSTRRIGTVRALAVAVLAVTGLALGGCADRPADPAGPSVGGPVDPSVGGAVAAEPALLRADELGRVWTVGATDQGQPSWPWAQGDCSAYRDENFPAQRHRRSAVARQYQHPPSRAVALQVVEAYEQGWAERALEDVRRVLRDCGAYPAYGGQVSFSLLDSDFAGDAALLVRGRIEVPGGPATVSYFVVVRRGAVVSTLNLPDPGGEQQARAAAGRLAEHLGRH